jgi:hypothetical protein
MKITPSARNIFLEHELKIEGSIPQKAMQTAKNAKE